MMDTILNLGITDGVEAALAVASGDAAFAADTHRRFRESYARLVGHDAPADPHEQLRAAICTVFASWDSPRAVAYRNHQRLSHDDAADIPLPGELQERLRLRALGLLHQEVVELERVAGKVVQLPDAGARTVSPGGRSVLHVDRGCGANALVRAIRVQLDQQPTVGGPSAGPAFQGAAPA